jgi:hypothetical protein
MIGDRDCTAVEEAARDVAAACVRGRRPPSVDELRALAVMLQQCELSYLALVLERAARAIVPVRLEES